MPAPPTLARTLLRNIADALYPPACAGCGDAVESAHALCGACWREAVFIAGAVCGRCGTPAPAGPDTKPGGESPLCDACIHAPPAFDEARAAMRYDSVGRRMVLALKHGDRTDLARPAARWMLRAGGALAARADLVAPAPLHWSRLLRRRYNQAAELSRELSRLAERPHAPDLLVRLRATASQDGKGRRERHENVAGAFRAAPRWRDRLAGTRVLLVDDVMTTGATLSACAEACREAGAARVDALVLCRVARGGDEAI